MNLMKNKINIESYKNALSHGIHDFEEEAKLYLNLAFRRAKMVDYKFPLPTWLYIKILQFFDLFIK